MIVDRFNNQKTANNYFKNWLKRPWLKKDNGSAAIEFAFVAPVFITLIIGMFEVGTMLVIQNSLDAAAREAARLGMTGGSSENLSRQESIHKKVQDVVSAYSGGIVNPHHLKIAVKAYDSFDSMDKPEPYVDANGDGQYNEGEYFEDLNDTGRWEEDQGESNSFGLRGEAVLYTVSYDFKPIVSVFSFIGHVQLIGRSPVLNEAFP